MSLPHDNMESAVDTVTLLVENTPLKCNKQELVDNSNYFKVMFEGNFAERNKDVVSLEEINLNTMILLLKLLVSQPTEAYLLNDDEILSVLQTASILQFETIVETCVIILTERLSPQNCIKIWLLCETHGINPLYLKAKNLALIEFDVIKNTNALMELDVLQLHMYLANVMLQCRRELDVFTVCMHWYYENGDADVRLLIKLLSSVDFHNATKEDIREMMMMPDVHNNRTLCDILNQIFLLKTEDSEGSDDTVINNVAHALFDSTKRNKTFVDPVLFVRKFCNSCPNFEEPVDDQAIEVCYDAFKRKRKYVKVGMMDATPATLFIYGTFPLLVPLTALRFLYQFLFLDMFRKRYIKFMDIPQEKYVGCEGFHIIGYKEQVFMFGGEMNLGSGLWNLNFWVYDTIRSRWERKTRLPRGRRHFHSCICGPYLYIVGGTGSFRIIQENMFWYNYVHNIWSTQIQLPCMVGQLRCCNFNDQLLLLNVNNKCGYIFSNALNSFAKLDFEDEHELVAAYPRHFSIFVYNDRIYVKSGTLIGLELVAGKLCVRSVCASSSTSAALVAQSDMMESIVANDMVLTLYKCSQTKSVKVEVMSMLEKDGSRVHVLPSDVEDYNMNAFTKLFTLQHHYKMAESDVYVNEFNKVNCDRLNVAVQAE